MKKKILIYLLTGVLLFAGVSVGAFLIWASNPLQPMPEAQVTLEGSSGISGEQSDWLIFHPAVPNGTGFILYPGARVDPISYAPQAVEIARQGYLVVTPSMPLNLAVLDVNAADRILMAFPAVEHWAIGGHSLGGAMAAQYLASHSERVEGLVLWASFPASDNDLSQLPIQVTSISASQDALSTPEKINASRSLLPPGTTWVVIEGGNHSQFGWYGLQPGDNPAAISREDQMEQVVTATVVLLASLGR